jgi:23S rRNA pseudouridine2605 synthase
MRLNKYIALATGMSRRAADTAIADGRVRLNSIPPTQGVQVTEGDIVTLDGQTIAPLKHTTIMFHKPVGCVCSRDGQGSETIYDILPRQYDHLKPVGRLDKYSSGLLILTNDGNLANELTHPSRQKLKVYEVTLHKELQPLHRQMISDYGVELEDGRSKLVLDRLEDDNDKKWTVTMSEGRNRQIRRTFAALGYTVRELHRTQFGPYILGNLKSGQIKEI